MKFEIPTYGNYDSGETIKLAGGYSVIIELPYDESADAPWEQSDGHGPVSDWTRLDKLLGERILCEDRGSKRYYDFRAAVSLAKKDGWDTEPYGTGTKGDRAHRAAMADFEYLRKWCNNEWHYLGVCIKLYHKGEEIASDSLWGVESLGDYWKDVAREMIESAIQAHKAELKERRHWEARDVITA
jgi:hypothetical protein